MHLEKYIELLQLLHDAKSTPGFTNIELNLFKGLQDNLTLTELAVLGLYALAIGRPYMAHVRGTRQNALELGEFHDRVKNHCRAIIENPDLLLACDAVASTGALEGEVWDRPDFIYCVLSISSRMPHLRPLLVAFFEGALKTWERFTTEFAPEGTIARATPEQRASAWVNPTNDVSEGALGRCRQVLRHKPTMTDNQRIARSMYRDNDTQTWAEKSLTEADHPPVSVGVPLLCMKPLRQLAYCASLTLKSDALRGSYTVHHCGRHRAWGYSHQEYSAQNTVAYRSVKHLH